MEEYWTSKTSKKYVKMYHVDKLWPRGCHEMNTKSFTARPHMCNNDHFLHHAEEVWRTLFGDRQKSKGFFNYSLLSMVYTELILKKKVDWTSFPTTAQFPLRIGRNQKHIPDSFNPQSTSTKDLLAELKSRPNCQSTVDSMYMLQHSGNEGRGGDEVMTKEGSVLWPLWICIGAQKESLQIVVDAMGAQCQCMSLTSFLTGKLAPLLPPSSSFHFSSLVWNLIWNNSQNEIVYYCRFQTLVEGAC